MDRKVIMVLPDFLAKIFKFKSLEFSIVTAVLICLIDILWGFLIELPVIVLTFGVSLLLSAPLLGCICYLVVLFCEMIFSGDNTTIANEKAWRAALIAVIPLPFTLVIAVITRSHVEKPPKKKSAIPAAPQEHHSNNGIHSERPRRRRKTTILFLSASPIDFPQLNIEKEFEVVENELLKSDKKKYFELILHGTTALNLQDYLIRHKPDILHFSGHGTSLSQIVVINEQRRSQIVPQEALRGLFFLLSGKIQCVVLNACFTFEQASLIADSIDCVIGTSGPIGDDAAIEFSRAFYRAIANDFDVQKAFELGKNQLEIVGLAHNVHLICKRKKASEIKFGA